MSCRSAYHVNRFIKYFPKSKSTSVSTQNLRNSKNPDTYQHTQSSLFIEHFRHKLKNAILKEYIISIQTSTGSHLNKFELYTKYGNFDYSKLIYKLGDKQTPEEYLNSFIQTILDDIRWCAQDYSDRYISIVYYVPGNTSQIATIDLIYLPQELNIQE